MQTVIAILDDGPLKGQTFTLQKNHYELKLSFVETSMKKGFARIRSLLYKAYLETADVKPWGLECHQVRYRFEGEKEYGQ